MVARRGRGEDEGSAADPPAGRTDRAEGTWAPATSGGRLVSLDEDQFEALVRPLREARRRTP